MFSLKTTPESEKCSESCDILKDREAVHRYASADVRERTVVSDTVSPKRCKLSEQTAAVSAKLTLNGRQDWKQKGSQLVLGLETRYCTAQVRRGCLTQQQDRVSPCKAVKRDQKSLRKCSSHCAQPGTANGHPGVSKVLLVLLTTGVFSQLLQPRNAERNMLLVAIGVRKAIPVRAIVLSLGGTSWRGHWCATSACTCILCWGTNLAHKLAGLPGSSKAVYDTLLCRVSRQRL